MEKIKKVLNSKIIVLTTSVSFLLASIAYSYSSEDSLRVPMNRKDTNDRVKDLMDITVAAEGNNVIREGGVGDKSPEETINDLTGRFTMIQETIQALLKKPVIDTSELYAAWGLFESASEELDELNEVIKEVAKNDMRIRRQVTMLNNQHKDIGPKLQLLQGRLGKQQTQSAPTVKAANSETSQTLDIIRTKIKEPLKDPRNNLQQLVINGHRVVQVMQAGISNTDKKRAEEMLIEVVHSINTVLSPQTYAKAWLRDDTLVSSLESMRKKAKEIAGSDEALLSPEDRASIPQFLRRTESKSFRILPRDEVIALDQLRNGKLVNLKIGLMAEDSQERFVDVKVDTSGRIRLSSEYPIKERELSEGGTLYINIESSTRSEIINGMRIEVLGSIRLTITEERQTEPTNMFGVTTTSVLSITKTPIAISVTPPLDPSISARILYDVVMEVPNPRYIRSGV